MLALAFALTLQDPVDDWIAKLNSDDPAVRQQAGEELVKLGPAARAKVEQAAASRDEEIAGRARAVLRRIDRDEKKAALEKLLVKVDEHLVWVPHEAFALAADRDLLPESVREIFSTKRPWIVLVRGRTSEIIQPEVGPISPEAPHRSIIRHRVELVSSYWSESMMVLEPVFNDVKEGCVNELLRAWPIWCDQFPILALQDGFFVASSEEPIEASLLTAAGVDATKDAAFVGLQNFFTPTAVESIRIAAKASPAAKATFARLTGSEDPDAWWNANKDTLADALGARCREVRKGFNDLFDPLVDLSDPDADAKILKYLDHADPRVRRDALDLARAKKLAKAEARAVAMLRDSEFRIRVAAVKCLAAIHHPEATLAALIDDEAAPVREAVVESLSGNAEKVLPKLTDADEKVRVAAIRFCARAKCGKAQLQKRLDAGVESDERLLAATVLVGTFGDRDAADILMSSLVADNFAALLNEWSPAQLDALYALNRLRVPDAYGKLAAFDADLSISWDELKKKIEEKTGLTVEVRPADTELWRPAIHFESGRLAALLPPALLARLEEHDPALTFVLEEGKIVILPVTDALEIWRKWWKP